MRFLPARKPRREGPCSRPTAIAGALALSLVPNGCVSPTDYPAVHTVTVGADGELVRARGGAFGTVLPFVGVGASEQEEHLDRMVAALLADAPRNAAGAPVCVLFIHGGLNTLAYASSRATGQREPVLDSGAWPLFLQWNSSLLDCYGDHLFFVRQGEDWGLFGVPLAPLYLVGDLVRGVGELPKVLASQMRGFVHGLPVVYDEESEVRAALSHNASWEGIDVRLGTDHQTGGELALDLLLRTITYPVKLVEEPLIAGLGQPAWDQMLRRVNRMFHPVSTDDGEEKVVHAFLARLASIQESHGLEITLVAHSMGAMVANEVLSIAPELAFSDIVYLAAACSLSEYEEAVFPYLARHPDAEMHHVTLHPRGEVRESQIVDLVPRGSLLVWIDGFLARPLTPMDRTAGDFANLSAALDRTPEALRPRVRVTVFDTGRAAADDVPIRHADFARMAWWEL